MEFIHINNSLNNNKSLWWVLFVLSVGKCVFCWKECHTWNVRECCIMVNMVPECKIFKQTIQHSSLRFSVLYILYEINVCFPLKCFRKFVFLWVQNIEFSVCQECVLNLTDVRTWEFCWHNIIFKETYVKSEFNSLMGRLFELLKIYVNCGWKHINRPFIRNSIWNDGLYTASLIVAFRYNT